MKPEGPNVEQIKYWNEQAGPTWVEVKSRLDALIGAIGLAAIERAAPAGGEQALDVGCGTGQATLELGRRVGPAGAVLGIDISLPMLECARADASAAGLARVQFVNADAQTHAFPQASVDLIFSRFGVMFFADPEAAFANLRSALRDSGRLCFLCWQGVDRNPWVRVPMGAVLRHVPPPDPPQPGAPGPFSFADRDRVQGILEKGGFTRVEIEPLEQPLAIGGPGGIDDAVEQLMRVGPAAGLLRDAASEVVEAATASLREVLEPYAGPDGVRMGSAAWIVRARA